jgi:cell division protein FtsB
MKKINQLIISFNKYYLYLLSPLIFFYIGFHLINGNNGLYSHVYLDEQIKVLENSIETTANENRIMKIKIAELHKNSPSDIRDEMVRKILKFSQDNEYVIVFD